MITIKQVEAFYWTVKLGTFTAAADRLHTTQSAITKRIQEIESTFELALFDRLGHKLVLTDRAQRLYDMARNMLAQRDAMLVQLAGNPTMTGALRLGITEMTAMTWLAALIRQTRARYPSLSLQPRLDLSGRLQRSLLDGELDLAFLPEMYLHPDLDALPLQQIEFAWMGSPGSVDPGRCYSTAEIASMAILSQSSASVISVLSEGWLQQHRPQTDGIAIDNLIAIAGLAVAGLGVVCLPLGYFASYVQDGRLAVLRTEAAPPSARYFALHRKEPGSVIGRTLAALAQECCDFSQEAH